MYVHKYTHKAISYIYPCQCKHLIYHHIYKYVQKKIGFSYVQKSIRMLYRIAIGQDTKPLLFIL